MRIILFFEQKVTVFVIHLVMASSYDTIIQFFAHRFCVVILFTLTFFEMGVFDKKKEKII